MPFFIKDEQEKYKFELINSLPIATVQKMGTAYWVMCCPLCGCIHHLLNIPLDLDGGEYQPICLLKKTHPASYAKWLSAHPETSEYSKIALKLRRPVIIPLEVVKPTRKRKAPTQLPSGKAAA